jgi:ribose-phosphate pyrophosphokinase
MVAAWHHGRRNGLLVGGAAARHGQLPVRYVVTADSLLQSHTPAPGFQVESVAPLLADAIGRLHHDQPLGTC